MNATTRSNAAIPIVLAPAMLGALLAGALIGRGGDAWLIVAWLVLGTLQTVRAMLAWAPSRTR
jgi:hypothetical protein